MEDRTTAALAKGRAALEKFVNEAEAKAVEQDKTQAAHEKEQAGVLERFDESVAKVFDDLYPLIAENFRGEKRSAAQTDSHASHSRTADTWRSRVAQLRAYLDESPALALPEEDE